MKKVIVQYIRFVFCKIWCSSDCVRSVDGFFVIFVEFMKAFDRIPRALLIYSLVKKGIHGKILMIIKSMCSKLKSSVLTSDGVMAFFNCSVGTRQGCILSPFLFSLYLNELLEMLKCFVCKGVYVNEPAQNIMLHMYANDIVQGLCMVQDLQTMTDVLGEF